MRKINLCMTITSHLSDVQEINCFAKTPQIAEDIRMKINFVKMLVDKLDEGIKEMTEDELNAIWKSCNEQFGKRV